MTPAGQPHNPVRRLIVGGAQAMPRPIAKFAYDRIVEAELALERGYGSFSTPERPVADVLDEVTAVVKTFERPHTLRRLVGSIRQRYPNLRIVAVDDSRKPTQLPGVETIVMPYNTGISAGRQQALDRVTTRYFLLLDDDHVFYRHTTLERALSIAESHPEIDIMGGDEILLPLYSPSRFPEGEVYPTRPPTHAHPSRIAGLPVCDKVPNFFLGRTERLRLVGWDAELKLLEHNDFFARARGILTTVFNGSFRVLHARTPFDIQYMDRRLDFESSLNVLLERYGDAVYSVEGVSPNRNQPEMALRGST